MCGGGGGVEADVATVQAVVAVDIAASRAVAVDVGASLAAVAAASAALLRLLPVYARVSLATVALFHTDADQSSCCAFG